MSKTYVYRDKETNEFITTFLLIDITKDEAIEGEYLPKTSAMLEFNKGDVVCAEDPTNRMTSCWAFDDETNPTKVVLDIEQVKARFMKDMRERRNIKLAHLDQAAILAMSMEQKDNVAEINRQKQILRDLPSLINLDNAKTLDDFEPLIPDLLKDQ